MRYSPGIHWPDLTWLICTYVFICQVSCFDALYLTMSYDLPLWWNYYYSWWQFLWVVGEYWLWIFCGSRCHDPCQTMTPWPVMMRGDFMFFHNHVACILLIIFYLNEPRMNTGYLPSQMNTQSNQAKLFTVRHQGLHLKNTTRWLKHAKNH